jgi:hypothetical protein
MDRKIREAVPGKGLLERSNSDYFLILWLIYMSGYLLYP